VKPMDHWTTEDRAAVEELHTTRDDFDYEEPRLMTAVALALGIMTGTVLAMGLALKFWL